MTSTLFKFTSWLPLFIGAILSVCLLAPAHAQTSKYTDDRLMQILKDDGYSSVELSEPGVLTITIDGRQYGLINHNDGDLRAYYGITGPDISYEEINEWNRNMRLSRAFIDEDMDPVIEADLLSDGGISDVNVTEFMRVFTQSVLQFRMFIIEND